MSQYADDDQQQAGSGAEDEGDYGNGGYGSEGEEDSEQQQSAGGSEHAGADEEEEGEDGQSGGPAAGGKPSKFPDPAIAADYYHKATAGHAAGAKAGGKAPSAAGGKGKKASSMQMTTRGQSGSATRLGGDWEKDEHHNNMLKGLQGIAEGGWTDEHKKSAMHVATYGASLLCKYAGFF